MTSVVSSSLLYWEDFPVGNVQEFGDMLVTEADIVRFAKEFDPQPFHVDAEAAKSSNRKVKAAAISKLGLYKFAKYAPLFKAFPKSLAKERM